MGALFILASSGKVVSDPDVIANFDRWGYPYGFYMVIGILELLGGIMLFYHLTAGYASIILISVMIGATITHVVHEEWMILIKPLAHMAGLIVIFYFRFILEMKKDDKEYFPLNETA